MSDKYPLSPEAVRRVLSRIQARCGADEAFAIQNHISALEAQLKAAHESASTWSRTYETTIRAHATPEREKVLIERVAKLEQHISDLETSLENVRNERDQSVDVWRKRVEQAAEALADVLPGEVGRLDLLARIAELKRLRDGYGRDLEEHIRTGVEVAEILDGGRGFLGEGIVAGAKRIVAERDAARGETRLALIARDQSAAIALKAQAALSRLKPSGQVAEDVLAVELGMQEDAETTATMMDEAHAALSRLAAKAQGYDGAVERAGELDWAGAALIAQLRAERDDARHQLGEAGMVLLSRTAEHDEARGAMRLAASDRDAAVADNAALVEWIDQNGHARWCERAQGREFRCTDGCAAKPVTSQPHPGAALLERMTSLETALTAVHDEAERYERDPEQSKTDALERCKAIAFEALAGKFSHPAGPAVLERMKRVDEERDALRRELEHFKKKALERFGH